LFLSLFLQQAKERDHRRIMAKQELVFFHELSPGSAFWLPHGNRIYQKLIEFIRTQYWDRGYDEVTTPNMFNLDLWHKSGHAMHYKENMFCFDIDLKIDQIHTHHTVFDKFCTNTHQTAVLTLRNLYIPPMLLLL
jgi:threonyl-tRNA synthetase